MTPRIFLDHITGCRPSALTLRAMMPFFDTSYGTSSSPHLMGQELLIEMEKNYRALYDLFGASPDDRFVFTSSGAEAITQLTTSVLKEETKRTGKNHFVCLEIDEAPIVLALAPFTDEACRVDYAKVNKRGCATQETLLDAISARTVLVSMGYAAAQTGVIHEINAISALCQQRGILFHVDVTHAVGKVPLDFDPRPTFLTFNGAAFHAPQGTGGLFSIAAAPLTPLIHGEDEGTRYRGGPTPSALLAALGQAAVEAKSCQDLYATEVARLRNCFEAELQEQYPEAVVLFANEERLPHCSAIAFPGIKSEALLYDLSRKGVFASMGGGPFQQLERVLRACHVEAPLAMSALSFSFSKDSTDSDVEQAVAIIKESARRLRRMSIHLGIPSS